MVIFKKKLEKVFNVKNFNIENSIVESSAVGVKFDDWKIEAEWLQWIFRWLKTFKRKNGKFE